MESTSETDVSVAPDFPPDKLDPSASSLCGSAAEAYE